MFIVANTATSPTGPLTALTGNAEFQMIGNTCTGATLAPKQTCVVSVVFAPASLGNKSTLLAVFSPAGHVANAFLQGTGQP